MIKKIQSVALTISIVFSQIPVTYSSSTQPESESIETSTPLTQFDPNQSAPNPETDSNNLNQAVQSTEPFFPLSRLDFNDSAAESAVAAPNLLDSTFVGHRDGNWENDSSKFIFIPGDFNNNGTLDSADYIVIENAKETYQKNLIADFTGDTVVDFEDFQILLAHYGKEFDHPLGDLNKDGMVDSADYVIWRKAKEENNPVGDLNGDGLINDADENILQAHFGTFILFPGDVNRDGVVNARDLNLFLSAYQENQKIVTACDHNRDGRVDDMDRVILTHNYGQNVSSSDVTGPDILDLRTESIASNSVTINWRTNEPASAQIEYVVTNHYGTRLLNLLPFDSVLATERSIVLTNLKPNTTYLIRVRSQDQSGNLTVSELNIQTADVVNENELLETVVHQLMEAHSHGNHHTVPFTANKVNQNLNMYEISFSIDGHGHEYIVMLGNLNPDSVHVFEKTHAHTTSGQEHMAREHTALFDLVPIHEATHAVVKSGNWSDPSIWVGGRIPGANAKVWIPNGVTVTYDRDDSIQVIEWIRLNGKMNFSPNVDTALKVVTMVIDTNGILNIGSEAVRIQQGRKAKIIFADRPRPDNDPFDLGRGLISHGIVKIYGDEKASFSEPITPLIAGTKTIVFNQTPTGWKVGDKILIPSTELNEPDEEFTIVSIVGNSIELDSPLRYNHIGPNEIRIPVSNLTRNVIFESENRTDPSRRGHIMFMHKPGNIIDSAAFIGLGRTTTDLVTDPDGKGNGLSNPRGRYAVHFHRNGDSNVNIIRNSAIVDSLKWGVTNHDSYVVVEHNVAYQCGGACFATEVGTEVGSFNHNLAVRSYGSGVHPDTNSRVVGARDFGHSGHGFWLQGGGVTVTNNYAFAHAFDGIFIGTWEMLENGKVASLKVDNLRHLAPYLNGIERWIEKLNADGIADLHPEEQPFYVFNNVIGASKHGITTWINRRERDVWSIIGKSVIFNISGIGIQLPYAQRVIVKEAVILKNLWRYDGTHDNSFGIGVNSSTKDLIIEDVRIDGFTFGIEIPPRGITIIQRVYVNSRIAIRATTLPFFGGREIKIIDTTIGPDTLQGVSQYVNFDKPLEYNSNPYYIFGAGIADRWNFENVTTPAHWNLDLNGKQFYHWGQHPDSVPYPNNTGNSISQLLGGKSNQQLWDEYRLWVGGIAPPQNIVTSRYLNGFLADPQNFSQHPPLYLGGPDKERIFSTNQLNNFAALIYDLNGNLVKTIAPVSLNEGWNLVVFEIEGRKRTLLMYGDVTPPIITAYLNIPTTVYPPHHVGNGPLKTHVHNFYLTVTDMIDGVPHSNKNALLIQATAWPVPDDPNTPQDESKTHGRVRFSVKDPAGNTREYVFDIPYPQWFINGLNNGNYRLPTETERQAIAQVTINNIQSNQTVRAGVETYIDYSLNHVNVQDGHVHFCFVTDQELTSIQNDPKTALNQLTSASGRVVMDMDADGKMIIMPTSTQTPNLIAWPVNTTHQSQNGTFVFVRVNIVSELALGGGSDITSVGTPILNPSNDAPSDLTPPEITLDPSVEITEDNATIRWITNEASKTRVEFGTTDQYGHFVDAPLLTTDHSVTLTNLQPDTTYHFRIRSQDEAGNISFSSDYTFVTSTLPTPMLIAASQSITIDPRNMIATMHVVSGPIQMARILDPGDPNNPYDDVSNRGIASGVMTHGWGSMIADFERDIASGIKFLELDGPFGKHGYYWDDHWSATLQNVIDASGAVLPSSISNIWVNELGEALQVRARIENVPAGAVVQLTYNYGQGRQRQTMFLDTNGNNEYVLNLTPPLINFNVTVNICQDPACQTILETRSAQLDRLKVRWNETAGPAGGSGYQISAWHDLNTNYRNWYMAQPETFGQEPPVLATWHLWKNFIESHPDVIIQVHTGSPHGDAFLRQLADQLDQDPNIEEPLLTQKYWDALWSFYNPYFEAGFRHIVLDNASGSGATYLATQRTIEVLSDPSKRDCDGLDRALCGAKGTIRKDEKVFVRVESKPQKSNEYQHLLNYWILDRTNNEHQNHLKNPTKFGPEEMYPGMAVRMVRTSNDSYWQDIGTQEELFRRVSQILSEGHVAMLSANLYNGRSWWTGYKGAQSIEDLLENLNVSFISRNIDLRSGNENEEGLIYEIVGLSQDQNGNFIVFDQSGRRAGILQSNPYYPFIYRFVPEAGFSGTINFRYKIRDAARKSNEATIAIDVRPISVLAPDTTMPAIVDVVISNTTPTNVTIRWSTNKDSDTTIEFGTTPDLVVAEIKHDSSMVREHSVNLTIDPNVTYYFRIRSKDTLGNEAISQTFSFETLEIPDQTFTLETFREPKTGVSFPAIMTIKLEMLSGDKIEIVEQPTHGLLIPAPLTGDANRDGLVDSDDYLIWQSQLGKTGEGLTADFDKNKVVDERDHSLWQANYGKKNDEFLYLPYIIGTTQNGIPINTDHFAYRIVDASGLVSNTAIVTIRMPEIQPTSHLVAISQTVTIDPRDRIAFFYGGHGTTPVIYDIGDPNDPMDDVSNRALGWGIESGWQTIISRIEQDIANGIRVFELDSPFGQRGFFLLNVEETEAALELKARNPNKFNELYYETPQGIIGQKPPGDRFWYVLNQNEIDHALALQTQNPQKFAKFYRLNEQGKIEAWMPPGSAHFYQATAWTEINTIYRDYYIKKYGIEPPILATWNLWQTFNQKYPDIKIYVHVGPPHSDPLLKKLVHELQNAGSVDPFREQAYWDYLWSQYVPMMKVGFRSFIFDNTSGNGATYPATKRLLQVLANPSLRDCAGLDRVLCGPNGVIAQNDEIHAIVEAKPRIGNEYQFEFDYWIIESTLQNYQYWKPSCTRIGCIPPNDMYKGTGFRFIRFFENADDIYQQISRILSEGHTAILSLKTRRTAQFATIDELLSHVNIPTIPTNIDLRSGNNNEEGLDYKIVGLSTDQDGNFIVLNQNGTHAGILKTNPYYKYIYQFIPDPQFTGIVTFRYKISDGTNESAEAIVTISVGSISTPAPPIPPSTLDSGGNSVVPSSAFEPTGGNDSTSETFAPSAPPLPSVVPIVVSPPSEEESGLAPQATASSLEGDKESILGKPLADLPSPKTTTPIISVNTNTANSATEKRQIQPWMDGFATGLLRSVDPYDLNGNGILDVLEFTLEKPLDVKEKEPKVRSAIQKIGRNKNKLTLEEYTAFRKKLETALQARTPEAVFHYDLNGDGRLDETDLQTFIEMVDLIVI